MDVEYRNLASGCLLLAVDQPPAQVPHAGGIVTLAHPAERWTRRFRVQHIEHYWTVSTPEDVPPHFAPHSLRLLVWLLPAVAEMEEGEL